MLARLAPVLAALLARGSGVVARPVPSPHPGPADAVAAILAAVAGRPSARPCADCARCACGTPAVVVDPVRDHGWCAGCVAVAPDVDDLRPVA